MKSTHQLLAIALLAGVGFAATAQTPAASPAGSSAAPAASESRGHDGRARMQQRMAKRLDNLKQKLQITPAQEGAWSAFTSAMQPSQPMRPNRDQFAQMTTPERIDRMRELRTQRIAEMDRRGDATKTFYATLTPEQKKTFDAETLRTWGREGSRGHHHG